MRAEQYTCKLNDSQDAYWSPWDPLHVDRLVSISESSSAAC